MLKFGPLFKGPKLGQPNFLYSLRHIPVRDLQNAGSIIFLSHSAYLIAKSRLKRRGCGRIALALCK